MKLNLAKCKCYAPYGWDSTAHTLPKEIAILTDGIECLGVPIAVTQVADHTTDGVVNASDAATAIVESRRAADQFITDRCDKLVDDYCTLIKRIGEFPHRQDAFIMLRMCCVPKLVHIIRNVEPHLTTDVTTKFDAAIMRAAL